MTGTLTAMHRPIRRQMSRWQHALEEVAVALGPDADMDDAGQGWPAQVVSDDADGITWNSTESDTGCS